MPYFFANVPWGQHIFITAKAKSLHEALFYVSQVCEHGWSRKELEYYYSENYYASHSKDDTIVEWSFEGIERPIGVAEYEKELKKLIEGLPTSEQIKENI